MEFLQLHVSELFEFFMLLLCELVDGALLIMHDFALIQMKVSALVPLRLLHRNLILSLLKIPTKSLLVDSWVRFLGHGFRHRSNSCLLRCHWLWIGISLSHFQARRLAHSAWSEVTWRVLCKWEKSETTRAAQKVAEFLFVGRLDLALSKQLVVLRNVDWKIMTKEKVIGYKVVLLQVRQVRQFTLLRVAWSCLHCISSLWRRLLTTWLVWWNLALQLGIWLLGDLDFYPLCALDVVVFRSSRVIFSLVSLLDLGQRSFRWVSFTVKLVRYLIVKPNLLA